MTSASTCPTTSAARSPGACPSLGGRAGRASVRCVPRPGGRGGTGVCPPCVGMDACPAVRASPRVLVLPPEHGTKTRGTGRPPLGLPSRHLCPAAPRHACGRARPPPLAAHPAPSPSQPPPPPRYNLRKANASLKENWGEYMTRCTFNWRMMKTIFTGGWVGRGGLVRSGCAWVTVGVTACERCLGGRACVRLSKWPHAWLVAVEVVVDKIDSYRSHMQVRVCTRTRAKPILTWPALCPRAPLHLEYPPSRPPTQPPSHPPPTPTPPTRRAPRLRREEVLQARGNKGGTTHVCIVPVRPPADRVPAPAAGPFARLALAPAVFLALSRGFRIWR